MATPNCVRCNGTAFAVEEVRVKGARFAYYAICCTECGGVVNFVEYYNISEELTHQNKALLAMAQRAGVAVNLRQNM